MKYHQLCAVVGDADQHDLGRFGQAEIVSERWAAEDLLASV
jgi:hypothetical protein